MMSSTMWGGAGLRLAEVTGVPGSDAAVLGWRDDVLATALEGQGGVVRRCRALNLPAGLVLAPGVGPLPDRLTLPQGWSLEMRTLRFLGRQQRKDHAGDAMDDPLLMAVAFRVPSARRAEFNRWYEGEHVPILLGCPFWSATLRFEARDASPGWTNLILHCLSDIRALRSPERRAASATPWRQALAAEPWFAPTFRLYLQEAD